MILEILLRRKQHVEGVTEVGFEQADYIYEDEYRTAPLQHAPMEPHLVVAKPEGNGNLTLWSSCQALHKIRYTTARILQKPAAKVRVIEPFVGGGFGGKESPMLEPIAGRLAEVTGRPVRVAHTREEEFKNSDPSKTNQLIRRILMCFKRSTYF